MLGTVSVSVVLLESDGGTDPNLENWTLGQIDQVKARVSEGLKWWENTLSLQSSLHSVHFNADFTYADSPVPTPYEPVTRSNSDTGLWVDSFLDAVGFNTAAGFVTDLQAYNHSRRVSENTNWAFTIFVINSEVDTDGDFANGVSAFARVGGPYLVMTYDLGNRGIDYMGNVTAHESAHVFYALDERSDGRPYTDRSGYYNTQNLNSADGHPSPAVRVQSIMAEQSLRDAAYATHTSSPTSLQMIGWRDSDADGIFDLLDVPLSLSGAGALNPETGRYEFAGTSAVQTLTNQNLGGLGNDITLNQINRAQFRLDGGPWLTTATFGGYSADLDMSIGPLPSGPHDIEIRVVDDATGVSSTIFRGNTDRPTATMSEGVSGFVWDDRDGDSSWDSGEPGLSDRTIRLLDTSGIPVIQTTRIEPDDYPHGTFLNTIKPEATLTAIGSGVTDSTVASRDRPITSTGPRVFTHLINTASNATWNDSTRRMRIDFTTAVATVSLDAVSVNSSTSRGRLELYNAAGTLLGSYVTSTIAVGSFERMTLSRPAADVAYAIAGAQGGVSLELDNLSFGREITANTGRFGNYLLVGAEPGAYIVAAQGVTNWTATTPADGQLAITMAADKVVTDIDFGSRYTGPRLTLEIAPKFISENSGVGAATGTITRINAADISSPLTVTLTNGDTTEVLVPPTVTIPAGQTSATFSITPVNDTVYDDTQTVMITAVATGFRSGNGIVNVTDIETLTLTISPESIGENSEVATVTATLSAASALDVTVALTFTGTATNVSDYNRSGTEIVITARNTTGTVTLTAVQDTRDETDETIIVDISNVTNGTESGTQQVTAAITDDDPLPGVALSGVPASIAEAAGTATITATLSAVSSLDVIVDLTFTGTATHVSDYTRSGTQIVIAAGNTTGSVTLTAVQDVIGEFNETIVVDISGVINGIESGLQQATATITDDDAPNQSPVITGPAAATASQRPGISWSAVPRATLYEVWVTKVPSTIPHDQATVSGTSYTPPVDFGIGKFNLWVRAKNSVGVGAWTPKYTFVINTPVTPQAITRLQPTLRPTITWNALPGAAKYDVWINDVSRGITQKIRNMNVTQTLFTPSADLPLGLYRAWVRGIAADGTAGAWSTGIEFVTMQAPTITQGQNSTFDPTPTFAWNALPGAAKYEVFIRNGNTGATTINKTNITGLSFTPTTPIPDGPYRWWAIGVSAQGVRSFWTAPIDIFIGGRTDLLTPLGSSSDTTPTFTWRPVDGAVRYDLFVNHVGGQNQIIRQQNLTGTNYTPTKLLPIGSYRAWIRAVSTTGEISPWSLEVAFKIVASRLIDDSDNPAGLPGVLLAVLTSKVQAKDQGSNETASPRRIDVIQEFPREELITSIDGFRPASLPAEYEAVQSDQFDDDLVVAVIDKILDGASF